MTHMDSNALATYNSLADPHLQCYFSNERIRSHLRHAGLISRRGEIIPDRDYRLKLARREHKKHVRQMLAENIVHRAIDMERTRQAELKRQLDMVAKVALVHSVKESKRRSGYSSTSIQNPTDMGLLSMDSSWPQSRPKSASHHREIITTNEEFGEVNRVSRVHSAHAGGDHHSKYSSKSFDRRRPKLNRPKSSSVQRSLQLQRYRASEKSMDTSLSNPPCRVTMVYYGSHAKPDYDHSMFEPVDEVIVMQQHCGGENLIVYKDKLKPGDQFTFNSRRHSDYPFGLSLYVQGLIDSRISTCCEYKHRHGVRLGGERGHFAILSVEGSKPCLKCRFEKQSRLRQSGNSPKGFDETEDGKQKPITISIPISDETKTKQRSVEIPVRKTQKPNENYAEDFDESYETESLKREHSSESNREKLKIEKNVPETSLTADPLKTPTENSSTSTIKSPEKSTTKTWQITFHTSNKPNSSFKLPKATSINAHLKFSFLSADEKDETEQYDIDMADFTQCFQSGRQDSFRTKLRNIGTPQKIRLILELTKNDDENNDDDNEDIQWHLDHIELIDPKTLSHYKFPCNEWIRPSEEKILNIMDSSKETMSRKTSKSSSNSKNSSSSSVHKNSSPKRTTNSAKPKVSTRSSSSSLPSSYESPNRLKQSQKSTLTTKRRISTDDESTNSKNKVRYRVVIYTSKTSDGEFCASNDSQIFIRLNNQPKKSFIVNTITKMCPSFESGESQSFELDLMQNSNEQPTKLTIGYYNSDIAAGKWKLNKIILINEETGQETTFICKDALVRNDFDLQAEQTFSAQTKQSDDDNDEENSTPRNLNGTKRAIVRSESEESNQQKEVQLPIKKRNQSLSSESLAKDTPKSKNDQKTPSTNSSRSLKDTEDNDDDENNEYNRTFEPKDSNNKTKIDGSSSRPKTRRGPQNNLENDTETEDTNSISQKITDIWRPESELDMKEPVDPLVGLDDLQDQTSRSNNLKTQNSSSSTRNNNTNVQFKNWYRGSSEEDNKS